MMIKLKNNNPIYARLSKLLNRSKKAGLFLSEILTLSIFIIATSVVTQNSYSQENESITILISSENIYINPIGNEGYYFENLKISQPSTKPNYAYYTDTDPINFNSPSIVKTLINKTDLHSVKNRKNSSGTTSYVDSERTYTLLNYYEYNGQNNTHKIETIRTDKYIFLNAVNAIKNKDFEIYVPAKFDCYPGNKEISFGSGIKSVLKINNSLQLDAYNNVNYSYFDNLLLPAAGVELHCGDSFRMGTDFNIINNHYSIKNRFEYTGDFFTFGNNNKLTFTSEFIGYDPELFMGLILKNIFYIKAYKEEITDKSQYIPKMAKIIEKDAAGIAVSFYHENLRLDINAAALGVKPLFTISSENVSFNTPDSYIFSAMMNIETKNFTFNLENFTILKNTLINTAGIATGLKEIKIDGVYIHIRPQFYLTDYFTDFVVNVNNGFELRFYDISLVYTDINAGVCFTDFTGGIQVVPDFKISGGVKLFF